jgi:glyoxylate reductase
MNKPKLYVTHRLFEAARAILEKDCEVEYWEGEDRPGRELVLEKVRGKVGLVSLLTERIDCELLEAGKDLRIVSNVAVGFDNVDLAACTARGVVVTNTPGVLNETTADLAWALMMSVARRLGEGEALIRSGQWKKWNLDQLLGTDVWGKTLGIVGFGRIGRAMARRAAGFAMKVLYSNPKRVSDEIETGLKAEYRELDALLGEADFVSIHLPLRENTRRLFGADQLLKMKRTAYLINTSRGAVVDEAELAAALDSGVIAGAGLDVFEKEPEVHPGLLRANVVLTPHLGSASRETRTKMARMAAENIAAFFAGRQPPNCLNPEALAVSR